MISQTEQSHINVTYLVDLAASRGLLVLAQGKVRRVLRPVQLLALRDGECRRGALGHRCRAAQGPQRGEHDEYCQTGGHRLAVF